MKRALALFLFLVAHAHAHMMSMSTGDAIVTGNHVQYFLRVPMYEAQDSSKLLAHIQFSSGGDQALTLNQNCYPDAASGNYICAAYYEFPSPVETLDVHCTLYQVTVQNHVHLLHAERNGKTDQGIFDFTFTQAHLQFRPPTALETAITQAAAGAKRALTGPIQLLFLLALALAARTRKELLLLTAMFLAGQIAGALLPLHLAARFVESAAALTVAYLAIEILFLPEAGLRWLIAAVLGIVHGLYFALFLQSTREPALYILTGAAVAETLVIATAAAVSLRLSKYRAIPAYALLVTGLAWFLIRLR